MDRKQRQRQEAWLLELLIDYQALGDVAQQFTPEEEFAFSFGGHVADLPREAEEMLRRIQLQPSDARCAHERWLAPVCRAFLTKVRLAEVVGDCIPGE